ncbi:hypothetical protein MSAN_02290600 [Mycena sanguinolenta]|uniref:Uncharacterized protein n=1 Tax=Mycena sanguinolenta TaxID=230812 RepID=A0A8H6X9B3_9AGAR|nr:hypothetical protein MSAN_02290600 [Mycena sanguinolenta]
MPPKVTAASSGTKRKRAPKKDAVDGVPKQKRSRKAKASPISGFCRPCAEVSSGSRPRRSMYDRDSRVSLLSPLTILSCFSQSDGDGVETPPTDPATGVDLVAPSLLGYAILAIPTDVFPDQPKLVLGPLQRDVNRAQVNRLVELGLGGLQRESVQHALAVSADPDLIDGASLTKSAAGPFRPVAFKAGAEEATMLLQAGQHRRRALSALFRNQIDLFLTLSEIECGGDDLERKLADVTAYLRKHATWLVAFYDRGLERNPEEYFPFLLQVGSNNHLGPLRDSDADYYNNLVRAVGNVGSDAGRHKIREWAAGQKDTAVRKLVHRFPDVIELFSELHKIRAFREKSVAPADLLECKRVNWGFFEPCVRGMLLVVRWLASPQGLPLSRDEALSQSTAATVHKRLARKLAAEPDFAYSQRLVDVLVEGAGGLFVAHLERHMAFFGAGTIGKAPSTWRSAFRAYTEAVVAQAAGWVMQAQAMAREVGRDFPPLTADEVKTVDRLGAKLRAILDFPDVAAGYPMLPQVSSTTFPLLCPAAVIALLREFEAITPLCRLVRLFPSPYAQPDPPPQTASWFVPGVTDAAKLRIGTRSVHTDPIPSETEQILAHLQYFQHRDTGGMDWARLSPAQIGDVVPPGHRASNAHLLRDCFYEIIGAILCVRGCKLAELFPVLAANVWAKLDDDDDDGDAEGLTPEQEKAYLAAMNLWAKESVARAPGATTKGHTQLRLVQACPAEIAEQLPDDLREFCERTSINWTAATSGVRNNQNGRRRFLDTASLELRTTTAFHLPLLDSEPGLCHLRARLLAAVRAAPGLGRFEFWYEARKDHGAWPDQLVCEGDEFITLAGQRMELGRRKVAITAVLNKLTGQLARPDVVGVPLEKPAHQKQKYGLDPAVRTALWNLARVVMEVGQDVQSAHIGIPGAQLANDLSRVDDAGGTWARYRGLRTPVFASVAETNAFFTVADVPFPALLRGGRATATAPPPTPNTNQDDSDDILVPSSSQQAQPPTPRSDGRRGDDEDGSSSGGPEESTPTPASKRPAPERARAPKPAKRRRLDDAPNGAAGPSDAAME